MLRQVTLRMALIGLAAVGVMLGVVPAYNRHRRWEGTRKALEQWAQTLKREAGRGESYALGPVEIDGQHRWFLVSTTKLSRMSDAKRDKSWEFDSAEPDPSRFFVIPSGKWVETIEEVVPTWDRFRHRAPVP